MLSIVLIIFAVSVGQLETVEISCEKFVHVFPSKKCCYLNENTVISAVNFTVADLEHGEVDGILFNDNKDVGYLPVEVYKKFPNLVYFWASNTSIKEISALNFDRLSSLDYLGLANNQIEFVPNFCFESLIRVEYINLSMKNKCLAGHVTDFVLSTCRWKQNLSDEWSGVRKFASTGYFKA